MPTYTYHNKNTGETFDVSMSIAEMTEYEKTNTHLERIFIPITIADPVNIGVTKPPADFQKHVLGRVKAMPKANKNAIEKRWTIPKEV